MSVNEVKPKNDNFSMKDFFSLFKDIPKNLKDNENKTRMIISTIPFVEDLLFHNRDKEEVKKIHGLLQDLSKQIGILKKEIINEDFLETEEFYFLLKKALEKIRYEYKIEKIKLFRNFLLNSIRNDKPKIDLHYFLDKLSSLELEHFNIIEWYYDKEYTRLGTIGSEYDNRKIDALSQISKYWESLENDLMVYGILSLIGVGDSKRYLLNKTGIEFFKFIKYDEE